jgi:stearoyl-CoA desaturase (delta-9 desaturase)
MPLSSAPAASRPTPAVNRPRPAATSRTPAPAATPPLTPVSLSLPVKIANLLAIVLPIAGIAAAALLLWGWGFSWTALGVMVGMYLATALGITVGYHRLFTHRSFDTPAPVKAVFAVLGSMAAQGPVLKWVAVHRRHHQHSDDHGDPHSPHHYGNSLLGVLRGLWHAHMGWLFSAESPDLMDCVRDLQRSRLVRFVSDMFPIWLIAGLVLPAVLGGVITLSWSGALLGFIWGGLVRVFLVHHVTWSINSVCHIWGTRPYETPDDSRNNFVFGFLALGEGWHNNHHAFPTSARHGLRWWEFDLSHLVIRGLALVKLARDIRVPAAEAVISKRTRRERLLTPGNPANPGAPGVMSKHESPARA